MTRATLKICPMCGQKARGVRKVDGADHEACEDCRQVPMFLVEKTPEERLRDRMKVWRSVLLQHRCARPIDKPLLQAIHETLEKEIV